MPAKYNLKKIKKLAEDQLNNSKKEIFQPSIFKKSIGPVVVCLETIKKKLSVKEVVDYMLNTIIDDLGEDNFKNTVGMFDYNNEDADSYLLEKDGINWYVKFLIKKDNKKMAVLFSFHPTDCTSSTESGVTYEKQEEYCELYKLQL